MSAAFKPCKSTLMRSRDEGVIPEPPDMRSVSDNGATAPISALTSAFSFFSSRGQSTDESERNFVATRRTPALLVNRSDKVLVAMRSREADVVDAHRAPALPRQIFQSE